MFERQRKATGSNSTRTVKKRGVTKMDVKHKSSRPKRIERRIPPPSVKQMSKAIDKKVQLLTRAKSYFDSRVVVNGKEITTEDLKTMANSINHLYLCMYSRCIALINSDDNIHKLLNFHSNYNQLITENRGALHIIMTRRFCNPEVYIDAANFMFNIHSDITNARIFFAKGLMFHKHYKRLYLESYRMEVQNVENNGGTFLSIAFQKFEEYIKQFPDDIKFYLKLLNMALGMQTTVKLQLIMIRQLVQIYKNNGLMYLKLAMLNLGGIIYHRGSKTFEFTKDYEKRMMTSFETFDDGMKIIDQCQQPQIWMCYADHIIDIWKNIDVVNERVDAKLTENMKRVLQILQKKTLLPGKYYAYWAECSTEICEKGLLDKAVEMAQNCIGDWKIILNHYLKLKLFLTAKRVLFDALLVLKKNSLPLWRMACSFYENNKETDLIVYFYSSVIHVEEKEISIEFKIKYLRWDLKNHDKSSARRLFKALILIEPKDFHLYLAMITIEESQKFVNYKYITKLFIKMCDEFSQFDTSLWINALTYYYKKENHAQIQDILRAASSTLSEILMNKLRSDFENLQTESGLQVSAVNPH